MTFNNLTYFVSIVQINDFFHKFSCYQNDDNTKPIHWRQFLFGRTSNNKLLVTYLSPQGWAVLKVLISFWIGINLFLFPVRVLSSAPCSDPKQLPGWCKKLLVLRQPMPNLARWAGQMVISNKFVGFWKHRHLAKIHSTSVSTPENFKDIFFILLTLREWCRWFSANL